MQTKTRQILIITILGLVLVVVGLSNLMQARINNFVDDNLETRLVSDGVRNINRFKLCLKYP